jgi:hypothetical protein
MIRSELYRGMIYAGATQLSSTVEVEQTGQMQLTVHAGSVIDTDGTVHEVAETVVNLVPGQEYHLKVGGVWVVLPFTVPEGCVDVSSLDIYVLSVRPGYPA